MLPEKLHIEQITRFHKIMLDLDKKIETESDDKKKGELCMQFYHITQLWIKVDEFIEFTLKHELDCMHLD